MVNRVAFGELPGGRYGLRVSRPGSNVLDPSLAPNKLAFDSGWVRTLKIFSTGTVNVPTATSWPQYTTVNFGKSFPAPPPCLVWAESGSTARFMTQGVAHDLGYWSDTTEQPCRIYDNRIEFRREYTGAYTARYIVLDGV